MQNAADTQLTSFADMHMPASCYKCTAFKAERLNIALAVHAHTDILYTVHLSYIPTEAYIYSVWILADNISPLVHIKSVI